MFNNPTLIHQVKVKKYLQKQILSLTLMSLSLCILYLFLLLLPACGGGGGSSSNGSPDNIHAEGLEKKWIYSTGGTIYSSPALASDGTLYIGSNDGHLYALDPDGIEKWKYPTAGSIYSSPAVGADGTVYVGSNDNNLYAIRPDGTLKWSFPTEDVVFFSVPTVGKDGTIFIGSNDGNLYALNPEGEKKWSVHLGGAVSSPVIGQDGVIYVGACEIDLTDLSRSNGKVSALKSENGEIKWETEISVFSRPAIGSDGTIYAGSTDRNIYALAPEDGTILWQKSTDGPVLSSPKIIKNKIDMIIIGSDDGILYAFDPTGALIWDFRLMAKIRSSAELSPDYRTLYIGCHDGCLHAVSVEDGISEGYFKINYPITSIPIVGPDGTVFFGGQDARIYAVREKMVSNPEP